MHREGMMKKMQTNQVVMTPAPGQTIRLNELNDILNEMERGEAAVKRLADMDASRGLQDPIEVARRMRGELPSQDMVGVDVLGNDSLAQNLMNQAQRMEAEARGLLAESERLQKEAQSLMPVAEAAPVTKKQPRRQKKATVVG
jgi:hypothetical protein